MLLETVLTGAVRGGTSILYASLGETVSERSGVINLGTEGSMLVGALGAYAVGVETGNPWLGVLAGVCGGGAMAVVLAVLILHRGANQIATGLGVTFLALGLTALYGQDYVGQGVVPLPTWEIPGLAQLPFLGEVLFDHDLLTYLSFGAGPVLWWVMFRTGAGLRLRAAGERPAVLDAHGISVVKVRWAAVVGGGALAGLGGAQLATAFTRDWSEDMIAGRGFVAVGLVIFAGWDPLKVFTGAYLFSGAIALQLELQARGWEISRYLLDALPYLTVIVVLVVLSRRRAHAMPAALQAVFQARDLTSPPAGKPSAAGTPSTAKPEENIDA